MSHYILSMCGYNTHARTITIFKFEIELHETDLRDVLEVKCVGAVLYRRCSSTVIH